MKRYSFDREDSSRSRWIIRDNRRCCEIASTGNAADAQRIVDALNTRELRDGRAS